MAQSSFDSTPIDNQLFEKLVAFRRDLHQHPELSWKETRTAKQVCQFLDELEITYESGVAGTGIVADIPGRDSDSKVALRADMDALPIVEETKLPFQSTNHGVMHACGHDGHTSILLGAASLLLGQDLAKTVRLIFQPAEETGEGAKAMIEAGALKNVDSIFGGHIDRSFPLGTIAVTDGPVNASSDRLNIKIIGKAAHAARPHQGVDSIVVGSAVVTALQSIISRGRNPDQPAVITVGQFTAGNAHNVIAGEAELVGTIRTQDEAVREEIHTSIRQVAESIAQAYGATAEVNIKIGTPVVLNRPEMTQISRQAAHLVVGEENITQFEAANMGGEDFGYYLQEVPGCYVRYGTRRDDWKNYPAHSSRFDFDEKVIAIGAKYLANVARIACEKT